ncbi:MAG: efflux transporter outer membrane subunit [Endomicrobia bacterium]|nr:efflux transporter outer membrane subunit [Endomicrobiia bacterium]MCL2506370.1 efflux transporter outer membrane subunit [Endomicrobiia bacterium]
MPKIYLLMLPLFILGGCLMGPNYKKPAMDLPAESNNQTDINPFIKPDWWTMFQDPVLNSLVAEALENNKDLQIALANVEQAQAQFKITKADVMPAANLNLQTTYGTVTPGGAVLSAPVHTYIAEPTISWELDIWGKQRRLNESAKAQYFATTAAKDLTRLALTANVVNAYFLLLTLDAQLNIAKTTVDADNETVRVYRNRYKAGFASELDLRRIEADLESVKASAKDLERQVSEAQSALAVLTGRTPREIVEAKIPRGKKLNEIILIPNIPEGIPSNVLQKRPDVLEAEEQLISANAQIGTAKASYFPNISLTAGAGYASESLSNLFDTGIWSLAGGIVQPLFEGGKIKAQNKKAQAAYKGALASYEKTVENAFKDVYDSLNANRITREVYAAVLRQTQDMQRSYDITKDQYNAGLIDTINLLDVKRNLLQAQMSLASARYSELAAVVSLSKALGGGWEGTANNK